MFRKDLLNMDLVRLDIVLVKSIGIKDMLQKH